MKVGEHFNMNRKSNLNQYVIDFSNIEYYRDIHYTLQESLDFPDYYGCNWDACWDCLKGLTGEPLHIEIIGLDVVDRAGWTSDTGWKGQLPSNSSALGSG